MIEFVKGNIFDIDVDAIVCPVNCVGVMGAGLALEFKKRFPGYYKDYKRSCNATKDLRLHIGYILPHNKIVTKTNFMILSFPTKKHWRDNSKIEYVAEGLLSLINVIKANEIKSIAIPALGCGFGGLKWNDVKQLITNNLSDLNIEIYVYEPKG